MNNTRPNLTTATLVLAIFSAFFMAQWLDVADITPAAAMEAQEEEAAKASRAYVEKRVCGPNAHAEWLDDKTIQCFTHRGRKTGTEVAAK